MNHIFKPLFEKLLFFHAIVAFPYLRGKLVLAVKASAEMPGPCLPTRLSAENLAGQIAEGKHKLSVLNAIRCKLLARVVSVVNNIQGYMQKTAGKSLV